MEADDRTLTVYGPPEVVPNDDILVRHHVRQCIDPPLTEAELEKLTLPWPRSWSDLQGQSKRITLRIQNDGSAGGPLHLVDSYVDSGEWWQPPPQQVEVGMSAAWGMVGAPGYIGSLVLTGTCGAVLYRTGAAVMKSFVRAETLCSTCSVCADKLDVILVFSRPLAGARKTQGTLYPAGQAPPLSQLYSELTQHESDNCAVMCGTALTWYGGADPDFHAQWIISSADRIQPCDTDATPEMSFRVPGSPGGGMEQPILRIFDASDSLRLFCVRGEKHQINVCFVIFS